ncbi:MAG: endolytic transglycosylase MltG [Candidatus Eisenbacteria bacterium]
MRRQPVVAAAALAALLALFGGAVYRFYQGEPPAGREAVRVTVPPGASFREIGEILRREGILEETRWLSLVGRIGGAHRRVQAGVYRIVPGTPGGRVLRLLQRGSNEVIRVTIPEGLRLEEVARILFSELAIREEEVLRIATDSAFARSLGAPGPTLEGYLFPDTYFFFPTEQAEQVLGRMVEAFRDRFSTAEKARAAELGLLPREAVTLASIVESEAVLPEEQPRIAAVYHNRLRIGWRLQADPTVQYALGTREPPLLADLEVESPYNTYRNPGLPPGPICSPGESSIRAALYPTEGSEDLFFVAAGEGGRHVFSRTAEEHGRATRRARSLRDSP